MGSSDSEESVQKLLQALDRLSPALKAGRNDDLRFLKKVVQKKEFQSLLTIHSEVTNAVSSPRTPFSLNALGLAHIVAFNLENCPDDDSKELFHLLSSPHVDCLLSSHDKVANKEYPAKSVAIDTSTENTKFVRIDKGSQPLGVTVKMGKRGKIVVSRVICGSVADKIGLLYSGDIIQEINGQSLKGYSIDDVADIMYDLVGTVVFKIMPAEPNYNPWGRRQKPFYVRTFFSYDPHKDLSHPCPEVGLKFGRGDVLLVQNQEDQGWWQAAMEGQRPQRTGLIPSRNSRERSETLKQASTLSRMVGRGEKASSKKESTYYTPMKSEELGGREMLTYEVMVRIEPQVDRPRPIVLVAPKSPPFDMEELRKRLIISNPKRFTKAVPHTSRRPRAQEEDGREYHFVTRHQFERDIRNGKFVEHGVHGGHYYGTSVDAIRSVMNAGKCCVLHLTHQALKLVRTPEVRPFVIYYQPPSGDYMRQHWVPNGLISNSQVAEIFQQADKIQSLYAHLFDHTLQFEGMEAAHAATVRLVDKLFSEPQWVPSLWMKP